MFTIFIAGDLFNFKDITGNFALAREIEKASAGRYQCILPQDWESSITTRGLAIRNKDIAAIMAADLIVFNFDGPDLDSGTVVEFTLSKMLDIPAVLLRTDFRKGGDYEEGDWNLMAQGYPRSTIIKHNALLDYKQVGLAQMHANIAHSVITACEELIKVPSILTMPDDIIKIYTHVITMCGAGLEQIFAESLVRETIQRKVRNGIYTSAI